MKITDCASTQKKNARQNREGERIIIVIWQIQNQILEHVRYALLADRLAAVIAIINCLMSKRHR